MNVQDSSAGRLLERLERDGMVKRIPSETDRRVTLITLTTEGTSLIEKLIPYGDTFNNDLISGISQEDLMIFEDVLNRMVLNLELKDKETHKL